MTGVDLAHADGIATMTIENPPVNALAQSVVAELLARLQEAEADPSVAAVVVRGAGSTFVAGADITRLERIARGEAPIAASPILGDVLDAIEQSPKPVVAAIDGYALGGGLELAMACAARVATPSARLGLPELRLGLIPGAGGTQRLPRLVGVERALTMMLSSKELSGGSAPGLIDEVANATELLQRARSLAHAIASGRTPWRRTLQRAELVADVAAAHSALAKAKSGLKTRNVSYPDACLEAVRVGIEQGAARGLVRERELFRELLGSPAARGLIHVFFAERQVAKVPGVTDRASSPRRAEHVGVIGGGTMGSGIATALLAAGVSVSLLEVDAARGEAARERVTQNLQRQVERGRLDESAARKQLSQLTTHTELEALASSQIVIEAASEDPELKKTLFSRLDPLLSPTALLCSNTSTIDIRELAGATQHADRVVGLHFFSPAHVMKLVEVVRTSETSSAAVVDALDLVKRLRKTPVVVTSGPGFLVNRVFSRYSRAAGFLVDHGVDPYRIDDALFAFGMPMGPCRMSDLAGIDVGIAAGAILDAAHPDRSYRSALRKLLAEAGRLGEKTGAGHYRYVAGKAERDPELASFVQRAREAAGNPEPIDVTDEEIVELTLFGVVDEACRALDEGVVLRAGDVDVASILGMGFPAYRGGPMQWAEGLGAAYVRESLASYAQRFGLGLFAPSEGLSRRAETGSVLS